MHNYSIFDRQTGAWLGEVRHVDTAADAIQQWIESFGHGAGLSLGHTERDIRVERTAWPIPAQ